jgi:hypothetical protein
LSRFRVFALAAFCLLAATAFVACGGGGGGGENPQKVLDDTFSSGHAVHSGTLDVSIDVSGEGAGQSGKATISLSGPFDFSGNVPKLNWTAKVNGSGGGQSISFEGGLISTGDKAFVSYKGTDYEVPQSSFNQIVQIIKQAQQRAKQNQPSGTTGNKSGGEFLKQLGISPKDWLTSLKNEGSESVDGVDTVHISGEANLDKLFADIQKIVQQAPSLGASGATPPSSAQIDQAKSAIKEANFDVFSGKSDNILRKFEAHLKFEPSGASGQSLQSLTIDFSISFGDVNKPQTISAPSGAKPLSDLLSQLGIPPSALNGGLGGLGGISGLGGTGGGGTITPPPSTGGGTSPGPTSDNTQKYLNCLQKAQSSSEIQACSSLLQ